ncbi:O-antigen ligase family protein [Microbacterium sp. NPDC055683]
MRVVILLLALVAPVLGAALASDANELVRLAALLLTGLPLGIWVALRRPLWIMTAYAFLLAAVPFGVLPSSPLPLVLMMGLLIGVTAVVQLPAGRSERLLPMDWLVLALVVFSALSVVITLSTQYDVTEFAKWLIATSTTVSALRLQPEALRTMGRAYVVGSVLAGAYGLALLAFDRSGSSLAMLSFLGYGTSGEDNLRYVVDGGTMTVRMTGTYVDPNAGGIFLFVAFILALALYGGVWRVVFAGILVAALVLTLSRAALGAVVVAFAVYILFQRDRFGPKAGLVMLAAAGAAVLLAVPSVQDRIFDSFGAGDVGSSARSDALRDFPKHMEGAWLFGLGWGRIEFRDGAVGISVNHVANAPLLAVYRGGLLVGLAFCAVLLYGLATSLRQLRSHDPRAGFVGAGFIGFTAIALQLDFPVITIPPVTAAFAFFLVFVQRAQDVVATIPARSEPVPISAPAIREEQSA